MSAIPMPNLAPSIDWRQWRSAGRVAAAMGMRTDSLARLCRKSLQARGLAMFATPPEGGQAQWFLHVAADRRLLPGGIGERYQSPDLSQFPREKVTAAMQKAAVADAFGQALATRPGLVKDWLPMFIEEERRKHPELRIRGRSVYAWHRTYKHPANLVKLIDARGGDRRS
jgi:hypothetical protein